MLPRGAKMKKKDALGSARGVKACVVRVAAALDPFAGEIRAIRRALSWESPLAAGALHVALIAAAFHPGLIFPGRRALVRSARVREQKTGAMDPPRRG